VGAALLLSLLTYVSFSYFKKSQRCKLAVFASLGEFHSRDAVILNQSIIHWSHKSCVIQWCLPASLSSCTRNSPMATSFIMPLVVLSG